MIILNSDGHPYQDFEYNNKCLVIDRQTLKLDPLNFCFVIFDTIEIILDNTSLFLSPQLKKKKKIKVGLKFESQQIFKFQKIIAFKH